MTAKKPQLAPTVQRPTDLPASPPPPRVPTITGSMVVGPDGIKEMARMLAGSDSEESEWMNRYADLLGCDPRPAVIAVKLERFMSERDTMQRTIGSLRSQLKFMRDSEPIPPPSLPTNPSNVAEHVPRAEQAAPTNFADASNYF